MKKHYILFLSTCFFLVSSFGFAQTDITEKRKLAYESFEKEEYEVVVSIIKEIKPEFKSFPLNLLGIEILSAYQIILKEPTRDFNFLDQTRKSIIQYLADKNSEQDEHYSNVLRAKYKLDTYPTDRSTFLAQVDEIKKKEEERKLQEEKERAERLERERKAEEQRMVQREIDKQRIEKERIEAEIRRKEQEIIDEKRRLQNIKIAEENKVKRLKEEEEAEKSREKQNRKNRLRRQKFSNLGFKAGEIANYGLLYETGGGDNFLGFHISVRSSLVPEEDILNGTVVENKTEVDLGPSFKISNRLYLNIGGGYGYMDYIDNPGFYDNIETLEKREYFTGSAGLMIRLSRVISISGGASFMDVDKEVFTPEYTVGLSFNLKGKYK